jgi:hypothetical protein
MQKEIIAGPCSITKKEDILNLLTLDIQGVRIVGLKSRSKYSEDNHEMGIDLPVYLENKRILIQEGSNKNFKIYPSIEIANEIHKEYPHILISTEIVDPLIQLPVWEKYYNGKLLIWNPSINQLGWSIHTMSEYLKRNNLWNIGIKNGKWIGKTGKDTWKNLISYIKILNIDNERIYLIHRGFDINRNIFNNKYRNVPKHNLAFQLKKELGIKLLFDTSHSLGKDMRNNIVKTSIDCLKKKINNEYIYDGLLLEVGESYTDTDQHIKKEELQKILSSIS